MAGDEWKAHVGQQEYFESCRKIKLLSDDVPALPCGKLSSYLFQPLKSKHTGY